MNNLTRGAFSFALALPNKYFSVQGAVSKKKKKKKKSVCSRKGKNVRLGYARLEVGITFSAGSHGIIFRHTQKYINSF